MISKKHFLLLLILPIFLLSLTTTNVPAPFPTPWVRIFVDEPLGYTPFQALGTKFQINIKVTTSGFNDASTPSIVGWKLNLQVNPDVLDINTTVVPPPPFPPPPPKAALIGSKAGYVMYDYDALVSRDGAPSLLAGTADPTTGLWPEIAEIYVPLGTGGFGDYMTNTYYGGPAPLVTFEVTSKNDTQGSLLDLIDVEWLDDTNTWHIVDIVLDGYYGGPPPIEPGYPSAIGSGPVQIDLSDPIGTTWHELYPHYSNTLTLTSWEDNGDGFLSTSDQIDLLNDTDGWIYWYHVDAVTTTIHYTFKNETGTGDAEPSENNDIANIMDDPVGSYWHQIYPDYSLRFKITDWIDNGDGEFGPSDQFEITYEDPFPAPPFPPPSQTQWAHLDAVSTDLIWSFKSKEPPPIPEFPLGLGLMIAIAPAIPIVYLWRLRKKVVAK